MSLALTIDKHATEVSFHRCSLKCYFEKFRTIHKKKTLVESLFNKVLHFTFHLNIAAGCIKAVSQIYLAKMFRETRGKQFL